MMEIDGINSLGDWAAALSIVAALIGGLYVYFNNRAERRIVYAKMVRANASLAHAKVQRLGKITSDYFVRCRRHYVQADRTVVEQQATTAALLTARDDLWDGLTEEYIQSRALVNSEEIEIATSELAAYDQDLFELVTTTVSALERLLDSSSQMLNSNTQSVFLQYLDFEEDARDVTTSQVGNQLRAIAGNLKMEIDENIDLILQRFEEQFKKVVLLNDAGLFKKEFNIQKLELSEYLPASSTPILAGEEFNPDGMACLDVVRARVFQKTMEKYGCTASASIFNAISETQPASEANNKRRPIPVGFQRYMPMRRYAHFLTIKNDKKD